jgi:phosphoglycolate phosphatase
MPGSAYDYWLLDLDGTLVDVEAAYVHDIFDEIGERFGLEFTRQEAEALWYGFGSERDRVLATHDIDRDRFWDVFHEVERPQARAEATHLYEDAAAFVPTLEGPVGLVTHCQAYLTDPVLSELGIDHWFDTVVCCTDDTGWKPDPGPIELARRQLGVKSHGQAGVLVGDDPKDVGAARNADIDAIHVTRRLPDQSGRAVRSDRRVASLSQLCE